MGESDIPLAGLLFLCQGDRSRLRGGEGTWPPPSAELRKLGGQGAHRHGFAGRARFLSPLDPPHGAGRPWGSSGISNTPGTVQAPAKRHWGYHVLPVLYEDRFVARFDAEFDAAPGTLRLLACREEPGGLPWSHPANVSAFQRFLGYLDGERATFPGSGKSGLREGSAGPGIDI